MHLAELRGSRGRLALTAKAGKGSEENLRFSKLLDPCPARQFRKSTLVLCVTGVDHEGYPLARQLEGDILAGAILENGVEDGKVRQMVREPP